MELLPKNDLSLTIALIGITVPAWRLFEIYMAIQNNTIYPTAQIYPDFFFVAFPLLCVIIAIFGALVDWSIAGTISVVLNLASLIAGKIYLPVIKEIISKIGA